MVMVVTVIVAAGAGVLMVVTVIVAAGAGMVVFVSMVVATGAGMLVLVVVLVTAGAVRIMFMLVVVGHIYASPEYLNICSYMVTYAYALVNMCRIISNRKKTLPQRPPGRVVPYLIYITL